MSELTGLFKQRLESDTGEEADEGTSTYLKEATTEGLCGGWVSLFLRYPNWVEPVYNAVRTWSHPEDLDEAQKLLHFERHLRTATEFSGVEHVAAMLRDAYRIMGELEPTAGYDNLPEWTSKVDVGRRLPQSSTTTPAARQAEYQIDLDRRRKTGRDPAKAACDAVKELTEPDEPGECMAHIESDLHHMALRVVKSRRAKTGPCILRITVVETEKAGIVKVNSWDEAQEILDAWLRTEERTKRERGEPPLEDITVRTSTIGFTAK